VPTVEGFIDLEDLGVGGFATVYSATDVDSGRRVALKVLSHPSSDHRRFQRECRILGQLASVDGIVAVLQATFAEDGRPVIAMELLSGGTLADRLAVEPIPALDVLTMGVRLAVALELAHRHGVFHRDIKPANVLFDAEGLPALADFGIALGDGQAASTTTYHSLSPPHSPPERFHEDADADPRLGDVWSLASTLFAALTGSPPFGTSADGGLAGLMVRITQQPVPRLERTDLPDGFESVLDRALRKAPAERYPGMEEFAAALWLVREHAVDPTVAPRPYPGAERALMLLERVGSTPKWWHGDPGLEDPVLAAEPRDADAALGPPPVASPRRRRRRRIVGLVLAAVVVIGAAVVTGVWWTRRDEAAVGATHRSPKDVTADDLSSNATLAPVQTASVTTTEPRVAPQPGTLGTCTVTGSARLATPLAVGAPPSPNSLALGDESGVTCAGVDGTSSTGRLGLAVAFDALTAEQGAGRGGATITWNDGTTSTLDAVVDLTYPTIDVTLHIERGAHAGEVAHVVLSGWQAQSDPAQHIVGLELPPTQFQWTR
jgi:hypothetical protein